MVVFSKLNDSAASGAYSFVFAYCVSEVSGAMLALAAVLLRGSGFVSSFVISAVEPLELLNLALSTHLLALVLLAFPFCRALQETRHENSSGLSVIDQAVQATATKETGMRHALQYNCTVLCHAVRTCGSRTFSVTRFRFRSCLTAITRARTAL